MSKEAYGSKCFHVSVTVDALVVARDEEQARMLAMGAMPNELALVNSEDYDVSLARYLPDHWDEQCLVYHTAKHDINAKEALELNEV